MKTYFVFLLIQMVGGVSLKAQVYEARYTKGVVTVTFTDPENQFVYRSDQILTGLNRRHHAFIYKLPADSLWVQWSHQGLARDPFEEDFIELVIKTKSNPIDMDNFDGENLKLECEIIVGGVSYNETALFRGFYNQGDEVILTSFRIILPLTREDYTTAAREFVGELEIRVDDAPVLLKSSY